MALKAALRDTEIAPYHDQRHSGLVRYVQVVVERAGDLGAHLAHLWVLACLLEQLVQQRATDPLRLGFQLQNLKLDRFIEVHGFTCHPKLRKLDDS